MGYDFNTPWRLTEAENQNFPNFIQTCVENCSVDLKLGSSGGLEDNSVQGSNIRVMESSASSGSLKRIRNPTTGNLAPSCLVDGCTSDLSKSRDYHRRHKVCELHSKTSMVFIRGREQRFCQQCSRFHSLVEFDEGKRSCRKRLDGHNRRRRKPQPDSLSLNSATLFSNHQGTRYLQFGGSQIFSSSDSASTWTGTVKTENDAMLYANHPSLNMHRGGKHFPLLQSSSSTKSPICGKMLSDGENRALSLLSSPPPPAKTREIGPIHMEHLHPNLPAVPSQTVGPVEPVLVSDDANHYSHDLFQIGVEGSSATGTHQTLSFSWE